MNYERDPRNTELSKENPKFITKEMLWEDNHSSQADEARYIWNKTKTEGNLVVVRKCSDARTILPNPDTTVVVNFIAEGSLPPEPQEFLLRSPGVIGEIILAHFDGETLEAGKAPEGCGGLKAKKDQSHDQKERIYLDKYIEKHIIHHDPLLQACFSALETLKYTDKPVFVGAQDHRTGEIFPIAVFYSWEEEKEMVVHKNVMDSLFGHRYDPKEFYRDGIPQIGTDKIASFIINFINESKEKRRRLNDKFPNLYEESKIQDPPLVVLSTNIIPFPTCFPKIGGKPGTAFEVFVPRNRIGNSASIKEEDLDLSLCQIDYPINYSLQNHGKNEEPFASTNTILIDTEHLSLSTTLAYKLYDQSEIVRNWLSLKEHKILISETNDGILNRIEEFKTE